MKEISTANNYQTKDSSASFMGRLCPHLVFYSKLINIVIRASKIAKKGAYDGEQWVKSSYDTIKAMESVGTIFEIRNIDIVRNLKTPVVFVANHMSTLETFALPCMIQPYRDVTYVIKESLATYPVFKHVILARNPIIVTRDNPRADFTTVMKQGAINLQKNISVIIFPQTTRTDKIDPAKFNSIGIKLAARAGVPVVPVALFTKAWGNGKIIKDFGKIDPSKKVFFEFGEPVKVEGNGKEAQQKVMDFITGRLNSWE